jgi:hypothetical protein
MIWEKMVSSSFGGAASFRLQTHGVEATLDARARLARMTADPSERV